MINSSDSEFSDKESTVKQESTNFAPLIIGIIVLLLPTTYVGAYFVAVEPIDNRDYRYRDQLPPPPTFPYRWRDPNVARVFWPLETIDRKVRTSQWDSPDVPVYEWSETVDIDGMRQRCLTA